MAGSYLGSRPNVLAKQPFSVVYTLPPGIRATKSSWAGLLSSCVVNVVVVLPVPDRPTIRIDVGYPSLGITLQPACNARPPRPKTMLFHIRKPPFLDSPK